MLELEKEGSNVDELDAVFRDAFIYVVDHDGRENVILSFPKALLVESASVVFIFDTELTFKVRSVLDTELTVESIFRVGV